MGSNKSYYVIWVITIYLSISSSAFTFVDTLDSQLHNYTVSVITKARTGVLHKVDLPSNVSGIEVSIIRLRRSTFWARGARFEPYFNIPPRIIPSPYVKRLEIMYENLGNWSSHYYNLPGYSFLAPIVGFSVYNASLGQYNSNEILNLTVLGEPITINFTNFITPEVRKIHDKVICVRFEASGRAEFTQMVSPYVCSSRVEGHFSIASMRIHDLPPPHPPPARAQLAKGQRKDGILDWKWWVIGFGAGLVGILLLGVLAIFLCKVWLLRRIRGMERKADKSEALSTRWIRDSRMPLAYMTRTEATLENEYYDP